MSIFLMLVLLANPISGATDDAKWKEFSSVDGRFSVLMPDTPRTSEIFTPTAGGQMITHIVSSEDTDLNSYSVTWTVYPQGAKKPTDMDKTFSAAARALAASKEATIAYNEPVWKDGFRGRELKLTHEGRITHVFFFFVKDHFFQVMVENQNTSAVPNLQKFLSSFRLVDGQPL